MNWNNLMEGKCPACGQDFISSNFGTRAHGCEDEEGCGFYMLQWQFDAALNGIRAGYLAPNYKPKFGDDPLVLDWFRNDATCRIEFMGKGNES